MKKGLKFGVNQKTTGQFGSMATQFERQLNEVQILKSSINDSNSPNSPRSPEEKEQNSESPGKPDLTSKPTYFEKQLEEIYNPNKQSSKVQPAPLPQVKQKSIMKSSFQEQDHFLESSLIEDSFSSLKENLLKD